MTTHQYAFVGRGLFFVLTISQPKLWCGSLPPPEGFGPAGTGDRTTINLAVRL